MNIEVYFLDCVPWLKGYCMLGREAFRGTEKCMPFHFYMENNLSYILNEDFFSPPHNFAPEGFT